MNTTRRLDSGRTPASASAGQDHHQLGADTAQHRGPVPLDGRAGRAGVEPLDEHRRRAQIDRCGVGGPDSEAERCRDDRQEDVVGGQLAVGDGLLVEVVPAVLGVDDAFGQPGGARRGVDQEDVVGAKWRLDAQRPGRASMLRRSAAPSGSAPASTSTARQPQPSRRRYGADR